MDAFEQVIAELLWQQGYWVRTSVKVCLTKDEKVQIGRRSSPRWELDIVAYKGGSNEVLVVECKSFLDSTGVRLASFTETDSVHAKRFKLFNEPLTQEVVLHRLACQMVEANLCAPGPTVRLALAAGKIVRGDRDAIKQHFDNMQWQLFDRHWIVDRLRTIATSGYDNQVTAIVAKMVLRS